MREKKIFKMMKRMIICFVCIGCLSLLCACESRQKTDSEESVVLDSNPTVTESASISEDKEQEESSTTEKKKEKVTTKKHTKEKPQSTTFFETTKKKEEKKKQLIVIDAGHQKEGNSEKEPIGPRAHEMKAKVASGTRGCVTQIPEYELTRKVSLKLQTILEQRGYIVKMVRTKNDINMSNAQRAQFANQLKADAFLRIHANGSNSSSANGALTICQTKDNPYNGNLYDKSKKLSSEILDSLVQETGCKKEYVLETDTMSGINWAQVPVTIIEMGYMTNPEEDQKMATEEYQMQIANGIANGVDRYFQQ